MDTENRYVLTLSCDENAGIIAAMSCAIYETGGRIIEAHQFDDHETRRFLMRVAFITDDIEKTSHRLRPIYEQFNIRHNLISASQPGRVLIMVSKMDHCLHDLLYRWRKGNLNMNIVGVVSNHDDAREIVESYGLKYDVLPVSKQNKDEQEQKLLEIVDERGVDLIVLARYMQILSDKLAARLYGRVINIHHSFLPSFKGARPYHQAHQRGVKLIGATAHYVTSDLDEGPIIEQEVARVKHSDTADDLVRIGRDTESRVLARAVGWHLDHRVLLNGTKTVVFE